MKAKTRHFPITDFGGRGGLNVPFNLSKIVGLLALEQRNNLLAAIYECGQKGPHFKEPLTSIFFFFDEKNVLTLCKNFRLRMRS